MSTDFWNGMTIGAAVGYLTSMFAAWLAARSTYPKEPPNFSGYEGFSGYKGFTGDIGDKRTGCWCAGTAHSKETCPNWLE